MEIIHESYRLKTRQYYIVILEFLVLGFQLKIVENSILVNIDQKQESSGDEIESDFSLAERNEISEKCFSHTPLGPGYRSCDLSGGQLFLLRPPLLTLLRFSDKNTLAS